MDNLQIVVPDQTEFIKCSACNKKLMRVVKQDKSGDEQFKLVVECCWCGDKSFPLSVYRSLNYIPEPNLLMTNLKEDVKNKITTIYTRLKK